jgi:hypothetical protein
MKKFSQLASFITLYLSSASIFVATATTSAGGRAGSSNKQPGFLVLADKVQKIIKKGLLLGPAPVIVWNSVINSSNFSSSAPKIRKFHVLTGSFFWQRPSHGSRHVPLKLTKTRSKLFFGSASGNSVSISEKKKFVQEFRFQFGISISIWKKFVHGFRFQFGNSRFQFGIPEIWNKFSF